MHTLRRWGRIRATVLLFLYFGILATVAAWIFSYLPRSEPVDEIVGKLTALSSALTGILTLAALYLTRLMGQIEMDILALIILETDSS